MSEVLNHMVESKIFSVDEMEEIQTCTTSLKRNTAFFKLLLRKDWPNIQDLVIEIFLQTSNAHIAATIISGSPRALQEYNIRPKNRKVKIIFAIAFSFLIFALVGGILYWELRPQKGILNQKWWPRKMNLVNAFYQRKFNGTDMLLVEGLQSTLKTARKETEFTWRKAVIVGFPAIGKTEMTIWYANHYSDDYDFIIWISCQKESLHTSLINLARQLDIPGREELDQGTLSKTIFDIFSGHKCLWIFDYAEYNDNPEEEVVGIKRILWEMRYQNFDCLITSQNTEWGREADYGKVQNFTMTSFTENESVDFLKTNLQSRKSEPMYEDNLERLAQVLGNFPLALQIAVNTLNDVQDESIQEFIDNTNRVLNSTSHLPDYGKTIYTAMKMSIDSIRDMEYGELAYDIMTVFGYLRAENIDKMFFGNVLCCDSEVDLKEALNLLQKRFLIRITENDVMDFPGKQSLGTLNIQRLLQLFMRTFVNEAKSEKQILIKILEAKGFIPYKLTPYAEYAIKYEDLQIRFNQLKAELIEQLQLDHFIHVKEFEEAVLLSKIIHTGYTSGNGFLASAKNYGLCLHKTDRLEEAFEIFLMLNKTLDWEPTENWFGVSLDLSKKVDKFQTYLWGISLLRRLGKVNKMLELQKELAYKSDVWGYLFVITRYIEPIDLYMLKDIRRLQLFRTQVTVEEYSVKTPSEDGVVKDVLGFYGVSFVDSEGTFLESINFTQLHYTNTRCLDISRTIDYLELPPLEMNVIKPSNINIDISRLEKTTTFVALSDVDLVCTEENSYIQALHLLGYNNLHHECFFKLTNLKQLWISYSFWNFSTINLNYLDHINEIDFTAAYLVLSNETTSIFRDNHIAGDTSVTFLTFINCAFIYNDNTTIPHLNFEDLNITNVKKLQIMIDYVRLNSTLVSAAALLPNFSLTNIKVDLSLLSLTEELALESIEISCTQNEPLYNLVHLILLNVSNPAALNICLTRFKNLVNMEIIFFNSSLDFSKIPRSLEFLSLYNVSCINYSTNRLSTFNLTGYSLENDLEKTKFFKAAKGIQSNCLMMEFDSSLCYPEKWIKSRNEMINFIKAQKNIAFGAFGCAQSDLKDVLNLIEYRILNSSDFYSIQNGIGKSINKLEFKKFCPKRFRPRHTKLPTSVTSHRFQYIRHL